VDLQRRIAGPLRVLLGTGLARVEIDTTPYDEGTTLVAAERAGGAGSRAWLNQARGGLVWDSRDREIGARRGVWSEVLVQRFDTRLGGDWSFTRWTVTDRRYFPLGPRLVFANRAMLQGTSGRAPFHELQVVQTSGKPQEGLGGAKTLRGLPKNRYAGKGLFLWNTELRWRAAEFAALGKPFHLVLSGFVDSGRTWAEGVDPGQMLADLHRGYGGGVRVGMGESFVVALDVGHSVEAKAPFYIGLGYLY
jgi:outer membrane protein assembly factor BamA